jgi:4-hydroxy-tetrahydrodipicolinate reductase
MIAREEVGRVRVGVLGATGRMGQAACRAILGSGDLELAAVVGRSTRLGRGLRELVREAPPDLLVSEDLSDLLSAEVEVVVDFSAPQATMALARSCLSEGIHLVSGTTGLPPGALDELARLAGNKGEGNMVWAPNFALGAVLATHFAAVAARYYPAAEIIELHRAAKADAPSGSSIRTAQKIAQARAEGTAAPALALAGAAGQTTGPAAASDPGTRPGSRGADVDGVRIHSVRLPGLVAHQETLFGGEGETLSIRHDSMDRASFMPGVLLAVRTVPTTLGLTVGLEPLLGLPAP